MKEHDEILEILRSFEVDRLLKLMALHARKKHDGHFSIFKFSGGYKTAFGTPDMDTGAGRIQLGKMPAMKSLKDSLVSALSSETDFYSYFNGSLDDLMAALEEI